MAIEGNTLSEGQVTDILDGKKVVAPLREIQEVKNAIATYDIFAKLDPFSVKDLLKKAFCLSKIFYHTRRLMPGMTMNGVQVWYSTCS